MVNVENKRVFGYARVSSESQNLKRQTLALEKYGVDIQKIYEEKESGKSQDRPTWKKLKEDVLRKGDSLVIKSIDRLGRNDEVQREYWELVNNGINIVILDTPYLSSKELKASAEQQAKILENFAVKTNNVLFDKFLMNFQEIIKELMTSLILNQLTIEIERSKLERERIKQRQREGIDIALKDKKVKFGRPQKEITPEIIKIVEDWFLKNIPEKVALQKLKDLGIGRTKAFELKKDQLNNQ